MVPLHVVPACIPDVVHPPLDAFSVQVEYQQEYDTNQGQHQPQENIRSLQNAFHVSRTFQAALLEMQERLAPQDPRVRTGQVLCIHDLSGVLQPSHHVFNEAVAAPWVPRQVDLEPRCKAEVWQDGAGKILQSVVLQVEVTQQGQRQRSVPERHDGGILQVEGEQAGEVGRHVVWRDQKVIVGEIQNRQVSQVPVQEAVQDAVCLGIIMKRSAEV